MGNQAGRQEETESGLLLVSWFTSASHLCVSFVFSVKKKKTNQERWTISKYYLQYVSTFNRQVLINEC